jgi:hypothetical protein
MNALLATSDKDYGVVREILPLHFLSPIISTHCYYEKNLHGNYRERLQIVVDSIRNEGLRNPLVVWKTTVEEWKHTIYVSGGADCFTQPVDQTDPVYLVMCGCRRLHAAEDMGYDAIECVVVNTQKEASGFCIEQRRKKNL